MSQPSQPSPGPLVEAGPLFEAFRLRRDRVLEALVALRGHAGKVGARTLAERLEDGLIRKLGEDRFNLVVVGEFNHGKTTFVNALLGRPALPMGVTPTTAVIHHLSYADEPTARLVDASGAERDIPFEDIRKYVVGSLGGGHGRESAVPAVQGEVAPGLEQGVKRIDVGYPAELLRERIVLVDTPGVNDLCLQRADITYKYIPQADAVLFVIDAGQPLKESERLFLRDKLIAQSRDKIIFVVAKADIWSSDERDEALAYVREELAKLVKDPVVFPVAALRGLEGDLEGSGLRSLLDHLTTFLAEERGRIVLDNALGEGLEAVRALSHGLDARRRAARMTLVDIERRIRRIEADLQGQEQTIEERRANIREQVAAIKAWVRRDLDRFCDDVIRQLPEVVGECPADDLKLYLPAFLESTFVEWGQREAEEIARALEELAEKTIALMRDDAHEAAKRLSAELGDDVRAPDVKVDTFGYDIGVFALFTVGMGMIFTNALLGGLLTVAAPLLAYYLKGRIETETRKKAQEQAATALREAAASVAPKLDEMVDEYACRLDAWVVAAGKELHREMIDVLTAARDERVDKQPNIAKTEAECDEMVGQLSTHRDTLQELRAGLWS